MRNKKKIYPPFVNLYEFKFFKNKQLGVKCLDVRRAVYNIKTNYLIVITVQKKKKPK